MTHANAPQIPQTGPFLYCPVREVDSVNGYRCYEPLPVLYFVDGSEVSKSVFDAYTGQKQ